MLWCPGAIHTRMKKVQCKANRERVRFESEGVRATLADTHTHSCARTFLGVYTCNDVQVATVSGISAARCTGAVAGALGHN